MFALLRQMPGETDLEKLRFCLMAGTQSVNLHPAQNEQLKEIRDANRRTEEIIAGLLQSANVAYEQEIADRDKKIAALISENTKLEKIAATQADQLQSIQNSLSIAQEQIAELEAKLQEKDNILAATVQQIGKKSTEEDKISDLIKKLGVWEKTINTLCNKMSGEQITFV